MAMHVLQLGPVPPPEGGVSRNMMAIRDELRAAGHRCSIIATTKGPGKASEPDVYRPRSVLALQNLLRSLKFDILHLHIGGEVNAKVIALAATAARFGNRKSVLTLHSGAFPQTKEGISAKPFSIRGLVFRKFSRLVAVNQEIADVFRRYGVAENKISVVLPYSLGLPDENVTVPAELSAFIIGHSPLLLAVGGLEKEYDPLFQIAAMKEIVNEFPDAGLLIVGEGSLRREVEQAVSASKYSTHIRITGNVGHAVTLHLIRDADILIRTTLFDGDAISVREALYLGTPVIATDNNMRPDGVHLIPVGDKNALLERINMIARSKQNQPPAQSVDTSNIKMILDLYSELKSFRCSGPEP